ncbi:MAG TPA: hypothetical protein VHM16_02505, partial [Rubrobacteraceae bacterium]|nr:hypothetical protein [Rubrobacteraceae bacterium]
MKAILPVNFQRPFRSPGLLLRRSGTILYAAALFSMVAAVIHLWVTPEHFVEWWGYGAFMLAAAVCQGLYAAVLLRWPDNGVILRAGIAGNLSIIALYTLTRVVGIPFGPHAGHTEALGSTDLICTASELGLVVALAILLRALLPAGASTEDVTYSRVPARPLALVLFSLVLAYGGGLWLYLLHRAEGATELDEPPFLVHWLRDSTLALPLAFLAVWLGVGLARRIIDGRGSSSRVLSGAITAATVAALASAFVAMGSPVHEILFDAHDGGHELPVYLHVGRDALLVLAVNVPLAALVTLLMRGDPWSRPEASTRVRPVRFKGRFIAQGATAALGLMLPAVILAWGTLGSAPSAAAANEPGSPCPVSAPVKTFDVTAIDVDITLNRFGDHDPAGKMYVLTGINGQATNGIQKVRQEETAPLPGRVSIGLHGHDAIQPLVIRANQGDCVKIDFHNQATGGAYGIHIDGLAFKVGSSGDQIGNNGSSAVPNGGSQSYEYYLPNDDALEGSHYIRPGPGNREAVSHGLFGSLMVEPPGSEYLALDSGNPVDSGWEASIVPGGATADPSDDAPSFREFAMLHHEIGNEKFKIKNDQGGDLPTVDPHTDSYRPGSRALNYRSEPFMNRLDLDHEQKSLSYNSYTFGDPATPMPRGYLSDPTKIRLVHAGTEMFHVYHLHGGGDRWRFNPVADTTYNYADTGLKKHPETT